jgi:hypothetical protein
MTQAQIQSHWLGLRRLKEKVFIWPDPLQLLVEGAKLLTYEIIRASAAAIGEPCPNVVVEKEPTEKMVEEISSGVKKCVLKREFSGESLHVFFPGLHKAVDKFRALRKAEAKIFRRGQPTNFPEPRWFLQPYLPSLLCLGEFRAFFVNGTLFNIFSTTPIKNDPTALEITGVWIARPSDLFK